MPITRAMITAAEVEKLRSVRSGAANVLSVYLPIPAGQAGLRGVAARAAELIDAALAASDRSGAAGSLSGADRDDVRRLVEDHGPEWAGHTVAIFACGQIGLLEAMPLPGRVPGRAVLDVRPHVRPLLTVLQRCTGQTRDMADPVIGDRIARRERQLAAEVRDAESAGRAVSGLTASLAAVNARAADLLLVPDDGLVPGHVCGRCGALTITGDDCPDWGTAARPVPDLLEEMAARVLDDGGQVVAVGAPPGVAARLRPPGVRRP